MHEEDRQTDSMQGDARWSEWDSRRGASEPLGGLRLLSAAGSQAVSQYLPELSSALSACQSRVELPQPRPSVDRCEIDIFRSRIGCPWHSRLPLHSLCRLTAVPQMLVCGLLPRLQRLPLSIVTPHLPPAQSVVKVFDLIHDTL